MKIWNDALHHLDHFNFPVSGPKVQGRSGPAKPRKQTHPLCAVQSCGSSTHPEEVGGGTQPFLHTPSAHSDARTPQRRKWQGGRELPADLSPFLALPKVFYCASWLLQDFKTCFNWNIYAQICWISALNKDEADPARTHRDPQPTWIPEGRQDIGIAAESCVLLCHQLAISLPPFAPAPPGCFHSSGNRPSRSLSCVSSVLNMGQKKINL